MYFLLVVYWQKGLRDFLNLLKHTDILSSGKFSFTIVGSLDPNHPDRLHQQDIVDFKNLGVDWIPWTDDIGSIYRRHDVLLFMSEREGGPRAVLEAALQVFPLSLRKYLVFLTWSLIASLGFW